MNKLKTTVLALLTSISINAQISLENTYIGNTNASSLRFVNLSNSGDKFVLFEPALNQIKLYNLNHTIWKTVSIPVISGFTPQVVYNTSESLFNIDGQVEFLVQYNNSSTFQYYIKVFGETGTILLDAPNCFYNGISSTESNSFKLLLNDGINSNRYVYSLPGTSSNLGLPNGGVTGQVGVSYPNPTSQFITLPYDLNETNSIGVMKIYDAYGQIIESLNVDNSFNSILLDLSNYSSGTYRYNITVNGVESISNSFIKQ
jgi:hypothetical protein